MCTSSFRAFLAFLNSDGKNEVFVGIDCSIGIGCGINSEYGGPIPSSHHYFLTRATPFALFLSLSVFLFFLFFRFIAFLVQFTTFFHLRFFHLVFPLLLYIYLFLRNVQHPLPNSRLLMVYHPCKTPITQHLVCVKEKLDAINHKLTVK